MEIALRAAFGGKGNLIVQTLTCLALRARHPLLGQKTFAKPRKEYPHLTLALLAPPSPWSGGGIKGAESLRKHLVVSRHAGKRSADVLQDSPRLGEGLERERRGVFCCVLGIVNIVFAFFSIALALFNIALALLFHCVIASLGGEARGVLSAVGERA
jgi:hypothetical protein